MSTKIIRRILPGIIATVALFNGAVTAATLPSAQPVLRSAAAPGEEMVTRLMVKPHARTGIKLARALQAFDAGRLVKAANVSMQVLRPMSGGAHVIKLDQPVTLSEARVIAARLMRNDPGVELAEPDRLKHPTAITPGEPGYVYQWHYFAPSGANLGGANLPNAWSMTTGSSSIVVAVIDTGILPKHPDLIGQTVPGVPGYDFITDPTSSNDGDGRDADPTDPGDWVVANECGPGSPASDSSWHGTHVSGTIAALWNSQGGAGIAPGAKILPVRVLGKCGGYDSDIIDGMRWAAGIHVDGVPDNLNPAQVLNMSLGGTAGDTCTSAYQTAINEIVGAGKVIVVSAGNDGLPSISSPANCTGVIAVTAHAIDGDNAWYSNIGPEVTLSAPGGGCGGSASNCTDFVTPNGPGIYSTMDTGTTGHSVYSWSADGWEGTSMATPHVAGVVALMLSVNSSLTPAQVTSYLQSSARPHPANTVCTSTDPVTGINAYAGLCGAGMLDAAAALTAVSSGWPTVAITNPSQLVAAGATVTLSGSATATAPHLINSYSWTQLSGASTVAITNATNSVATFIAPATGTYSFKLAATDDNTPSHTGSASAIVTVDSPPVLTNVPSIQTVTAGGTLNFAVTASDVDGGTLIFDATALPAGATLSADGTFNWPGAAPVGNYTLTYFATDPLGASSVPATVTINVVAATTSSGGGGCSLDPGKPDPALPTMMVIAGLYLLRRRLFQKTRAGKN